MEKVRSSKCKFRSFVALQTLIAMFLLVVIAAPPCHAWNNFGHMAVASVAFDKLDPPVRKRALGLLVLNPYYEQWHKQAIAAAPADADQQERIVFALAATWPDQIREDKNYIADGSDNGFRPTGSEATRNIGYKDNLFHIYWHFCANPYSSDGTPLPELQTPNVVTQIKTFRRTIAGDSSDDVKSYDLTWLLHLIGDVHQPLHCITRYSKMRPAGDGEGVKVKIAYPGFENLHWFWDCAAGNGDPSAAINFTRTLPAADEHSAQDLDVDHWLNEGHQIAIDKVYLPPIDIGSEPFVITPEYQKESAVTATQRIALAGQRLAKVLNRELK